MKKKPEIFYALVCEEAGIMGAFVSKEEAIDYETQSEMCACPAKHKIKKCKIILLKTK